MDTRPVVVITGATSGLGRIAALELARGGAQLGIIARSPQKLGELTREIGDEAPGTAVDTFITDLTSMQSVFRAAQQIDAHYERIDVLINNAGVHAFAPRVTADGFSEMTAVNYLAPWILTNTLRDKLVASAPARVVTVASEGAHRAGGVDPHYVLTATPEYGRRESLTLYNRSKLMDIMFSQELGRRLAGTGVTANCCDPGFNATGLGRDLPFAGAIEKALHATRIGDPRRGAAIIVRLATDPAFADVTSGYFSAKNAAALTCPEAGRSPELQRELWEATASLVERCCATDN
jgi:NAD(P)-dependent dehydrogenase (short-subunit alcohol dehydrogenase family)